MKQLKALAGLGNQLPSAAVVAGFASLAHRQSSDKHNSKSHDSDVAGKFPLTRWTKQEQDGLKVFRTTDALWAHA